MEKIKLQINIKQLNILPFIMILDLAAYKCLAFYNFDNLHLISYLVLGLMCLSSLIMLCLYIHDNNASKLDTLLFAYLFLLLMFTVINGTIVKDAVYTSMECFLFVALFRYYIDRIPFLIKSFAIAFSVMVYIGVIHLILNPIWFFNKEIVDCFLLGPNYNSIGSKLMCALITNVLCLRYNKIWIVNVVSLFVVSIVTLLAVGSMTSFSCITLFALLSLAPSLYLKKFIFTSLIAVFVLFELFVVMSGNSLANNEFAVYFIVDVLGKDITFTRRTGMWEAALNIFSQSPIIGYGCVDNDWFVSKMSGNAIGPHNMVLGIMINGGITLLSLMVVFTCKTLSYAYKNIDNISSIALLGIGCYFIMMTMEMYAFFFLPYLFLLIYYYSYHTQKISNSYVSNR